MSTRNQDGSMLDMPSRTQVIELFPVTTSSIYADSHPGFQRSGNEDSFGYSVDTDSSCSLMFVADGIGGNSGGDLASQFTARGLLSHWRRFVSGRVPAADEVAAFFREALENVNRTLHRINADQGTLRTPMGTTIAAAALLHDQVVVAHAGDSRVYRFRDGGIECLTEDHSLVQKWISDGTIIPEDAKNHPMAHVIYKSIGPQSRLDPDIRILDRRHGDKFVVCSDGLMCHLEDEDILAVMRRVSSAEEAVRQLIATALKRGGHDNVTVVCYYQA